MPITVELAFGHIITVDHDTATIGSDPGSDIPISDSPSIQFHHARIAKVANKWMIESAGDWMLQVGDGVPGRKLWMKPGDVVHLAESGPYMVFAPTSIAPKAPVRPTESDQTTFLKESDTTTFLSALAHENPPAVKKPDSPAPIEKAKKPETVSVQLDEDDEVWEEVYGYWMESKNKKASPPKPPPLGHPPTPPHK
jgi:hypothetical protein